MKFIDKMVTELLADFRAPEPTPGGGSASALAGALGASLLAMVAGLPKSKATTAEDIARLKSAGDRCIELSLQLAGLVDRDSEAYTQVVNAYKKPKATDEEKAARSAAIQEGFRAAIGAPLEVMRACAAAGEQGVVVATLGNPPAFSDVQVGLELLGAALRGAKLNVEINLESIKDTDYADKTRDEAAELERALEHETNAAKRV